MPNFTAKQEDEFRESAVTTSVDMDNVIEWVAKYCDPEEVFSEDELEKWARENGFVKEDEVE